jgi:hypothetical protein
VDLMNYHHARVGRRALGSTGYEVPTISVCRSVAIAPRPHSYAR